MGTCSESQISYVDRRDPAASRQTVYGNGWLGRRDSNPDTQIQSPSDPAWAQLDQQLSSAELREVGQNAQCERNANSVTHNGVNEGADLAADLRRRGFDFEDDTLP